MFNPNCIVPFAVVLIAANIANCSPIQQNTLGDILDLKSLKKSAIKLLDNIESYKVLRLNDILSIETIINTTDQTQRDARLLDKLNDISNTESLNLDLGPVDVKFFRKAGDVNVNLKLDPRKSKGGKHIHMLLPFLIGLKATTFIVGAVSLIGLLTLKAFVASKTAILIAVIIGLKKLFGENHKTKYESVYERNSFAPEYHEITDHHNEPEYLKAHPGVQEQKLVSAYTMLKDQTDILKDNNDMPKYEYQGQEANSELLKGQDFHGLFGDNVQEFKHENQQRRRSWKSNAKPRPLSLVIGSPHHEPPVLTYRKVVTGRNS